MVFGTPNEASYAFLLRTAENVDGKDVIAAIRGSALIDGLVHVSDFHSPVAVVVSFHAEADKDSILIESTALPEVRVIESNE